MPKWAKCATVRFRHRERGRSQPTARRISARRLNHILRVDVEERKIGLSLKRAQLSDEEPTDEKGAPDAAKPIKGGVDEHGALGTDKIEL